MRFLYGKVIKVRDYSILRGSLDKYVNSSDFLRVQTFIYTKFVKFITF